jgi:4-oxalocrotonate tautomerase
MPYISIESGKLTEIQKKELISKMTSTASEIMHIPETFFSVTIKELPDENFGIGGRNIADIKADYASGKK